MSRVILTDDYEKQIKHHIKSLEVITKAWNYVNECKSQND